MILVLINELFRARELLKSNRGTVFGIYGTTLSGIARSIALRAGSISLPQKSTGARIGNFPALGSLAYTNFRFLWAVTFFISSSFWTYQVVIGWLVYDLTKSPMVTSFALGTQFLPMLVMAPVCGILSDRYNRQSLLAFVVACKVVIMATFAVIVMLGEIQVGYIFGFSIVVGIMWCISINARTSIVPDMVPRKNLVNAYALKGLAGNVSGMIMPAVAGFLMARFDAGYALMTGALLLIAATISALMINIKPADTTERDNRVGFAGFMEAVRFIKEESVILTLVILGFIPALLLGPYINGLLPVYAAKILNVGPVGYGLLFSSLGAGSALGMIVMATLGNFDRKGRLIILGLLLAIIGAALFSRSTSISISLPILLGFSSALAIFATGNVAVIQTIVPGKLRGRVAGIAFIGAGIFPLGSLCSGALAQWLGAPSATLISALITMIFIAAIWNKLQAVWRFKG